MRRTIFIWTGVTVGAFLLGALGGFGYDAIRTHRTSLSASVVDSAQTEQTKTVAQEDTVTLTFVGDIMLDRGVRRSVEKNFNNDYNALFKNTNLFQTDDITFGNFEGTATTEGYKTGSIYSFRMDPSVVTAVKNAGIDIVSFANNHVGDYALSGFTGTMDEFTKNQLPFTGAGSSYADTTTPRIIEKNGIRIGYLGFSDVGPNWIAAKETTPGILLASDPDFQGIITRAKGMCDVLVVSVHWGIEYKPHTDRETELAHSAVDAGADIVVGTHPHVPQDIETYKNKLIIYSLGNFIFDQYFSTETMSGLVVQTTVTKDGVIGNTKELISTLNKQFQIQSIVEKADASKKELTIGWVGDIPPSTIMPSVPKNVRDLLSFPDIMAGNLEGALGTGENIKCGATTKECYSFVGTNEFASLLQAIGFDAVNIANNHAYDAGKIGLLDTKNILSANKLLAVGEYGTVTTTTIHGVDVALVGFGTNYWTDSLSAIEKIRTPINNQLLSSLILTTLCRLLTPNKRITA
jgi:poly-gamma-glutamate synthesis protein (capsule biosynthesis protein)